MPITGTDIERPACKIGPTAGGQAPPTCSACRVLRGPARARVLANSPRCGPGRRGARIDLLFTMSDSSRPRADAARGAKICSKRTSIVPAGGARRDRTDDLLLAKQALSQLSYGPSGERKSEIRMLGTQRAA